jgi:hypothetical protein
MIVLCLCGAQTHLNRNTCGTQHRQTTAIYARVRVAQRHNHPRNAGINQGLRTGRRLSMMGTRL